VTAAVVLAVAVVVMFHSAPRTVAPDNVRLLGYPVTLQPGQQVCQTGERGPAGARTLAISAAPLRGQGPALELSVAGRTIQVPGGYRDGELHIPLPAGLPSGKVCIHNAGPGAVGLGGQTSALPIAPGIGATVDGAAQPVAVQLRWRTEPRSGWADLGDVLRRWGYVTALGAATPYVAIVLFLLAFAGAAVLAVRGRATALACAAIGFACAAGWALTTPLFHVPDEPQHIAYEQRLAESGHVPTPVKGPVFSPEEGALFNLTQFNQVIGNRTDGRPPWTAAQDRDIDRILAEDPGRFTPGGLTNTTNNPPLYYLAELGPYWIATAAGGGFLERVLALRLGSALLVAATVWFVFMFLRELLPRRPWLWPVGALALAVQPLLGFIGGGVNNDAGLFAAGAAVCWLAVRALRHGLDRRGAIGIGAAFGLGLITKATIVGFAPGLLVCAAVLLWRAGPARWAVARRIGLAALVAAAPVIAYVVVNSQIWDRGLWTGGGTVSSTGGGRPAQLSEFVSYLWQFDLPRLPFMTDLQAGIPLYNVWFNGFIGRFGWLDTMFPSAVYSGAAIAFAALLALAARTVWVSGRAWRARIPEAVVLIALVAGFLLVVGWAGYRGRLDNGQIFEQARYLLPLGALYALLIALAARGAGRFGRLAGAVLVTLACGHALFAVGLVVSRFYA
jgi:hypothetical protein